MSVDLIDKIKKVRNLVGDGKIDHAFTHLLHLSEISKNQKNELLLLKNKHSTLVSNYSLGLISNSFYVQENMKTCQAILFLIDKIEVNPSSNSKSDTWLQRPKKYIIIISLLFMATSFGVYAFYQKRKDIPIENINRKDIDNCYNDKYLLGLFKEAEECFNAKRSLITRDSIKKAHKESKLFVAIKKHLKEGGINLIFAQKHLTEMKGSIFEHHIDDLQKKVKNELDHYLNKKNNLGGPNSKNSPADSSAVNQLIEKINEF